MKENTFRGLTPKGVHNLTVPPASGSMTLSIGDFASSKPQDVEAAGDHQHHHRTREAAETYFECITTCSLDDGECVTLCVEELRQLS